MKMTKEQSDYVKRNWLNLANIITIVSAIWYMSAWKTNIENDIESIRTEIKTHTDNTNVHMSFDQKVNYFVPRSELTIHIENIYDALDRIEKHLKP